MKFSGIRGRRGVDLKTGVAVTIAVAAALALVPTAAQATGKSWGTFTVSDGGTVRAQAWGTASVTSTHLQNHIGLTSTSQEAARVETTWEYHEETQNADGTYHTTWTYEGRSDTANSWTINTTYYTVSSLLQDDASEGRVEPRLCLPRPWGVPVPCSQTAILTFSY